MTPATRSSIQSRPWTTRVGSPEVTSATPSLTECTRPTTSGWAAVSGATRRSTGSSAPGLGDHAHQHLAGRDALAHQNVAQLAGVRALVVGGQALGDRPGAHRLAHRVAERAREQARLDVHDLVPAAAHMEAEVQRPVRPRARPSTPSCCGSRTARSRRRARARPRPRGARCGRDARRPGRAWPRARARTPRAEGGTRRSGARTGRAAAMRRGPGLTTSTRSASAKRRRAFTTRARTRSPGAVSRQKTT